METFSMLLTLCEGNPPVAISFTDTDLLQIGHSGRHFSEISIKYIRQVSLKMYLKMSSAT